MKKKIDLPDIKILCASDLHLTKADQLQAKLGVKSVNANIDFVIIAGDLTDMPADVELTYSFLLREGAEVANKVIWQMKLNAQEKLWDQLINVEFHKLFPNAEIFILPGNHDSVVKPSNNGLVHVLGNDNSPNCDIITVNTRLGYPINIAWHNGITYDCLFKGSGKPLPPYKNRLISEKQFGAELENLANKAVFLNKKIDIFISHVPPSGKYSHSYLDNTDIGSKALLYYANTVFSDCRYFIFGHNHNRPENVQILEFNSECKPQTFINCSIDRDDTAKEIHKPVIIDYIPRLSNTKSKSLFNRWKWWKRYTQSIKKFWLAKQGLPANVIICPYCKNKGVPVEFNAKNGCPDCIEKKYLFKLSEKNFLDKEFDNFNQEYEKSQEMRSTHE